MSARRERRSLRSGAVTQARLIITQLTASYPVTFQRPALGTRAHADMVEDPVRKEYLNWLDGLPQGIDIAINKDVTVDGVEFDRLRQGGLLCPDENERAQWKHVFWGANNLVSVEQSMAPLPDGLVRGSEY